MISNKLHTLLKRYGDFTLTPLSGGYTNETFLLNGPKTALVVKVALHQNHDIQNEVSCLKITQKWRETPEFYEFIQTNDLQITVMEYCEGVNAQKFLDHYDVEKTKLLYKLLGETLAQTIHALKYNSSSYGINECNLGEIPFTIPFVPDNLINETKNLLQGMKDSRDDWVLTHGDFGVHNVLFTDDNRLTVIDWEWSEWGNPVSDIAWVCWFTKLHYPNYADVLIPLFIEGYNTYKPIHLTSDVLKRYSLYKVWKILHRVRDSSIEVQQEWIRRLKWTIETDF